jgi:hypothetical protein
VNSIEKVLKFKKSDMMHNKLWRHVMQEITIEYLCTQNFEKTGLEEPTYEKTNVSGMFTKSELTMLPPSDEDKQLELNIKVGDYIHDKLGSYRNLEMKCNLSSETIRKAIRINGKKKLSRLMLAKLVVGANLSLDEAEELFDLQGSGLNPKSTLLDAVVVHCIQKGLDIDGFFDTCKQVGLDIEYKTWG